MIQVYCNDESKVNKWLKEHLNVEVIDIKMSLNDDGELIMVIYEEGDSDD